MVRICDNYFLVELQRIAVDFSQFVFPLYHIYFPDDHMATMKCIVTYVLEHSVTSSLAFTVMYL